LHCIQNQRCRNIREHFKKDLQVIIQNEYQVLYFAAENGFEEAEQFFMEVIFIDTEGFHGYF